MMTASVETTQRKEAAHARFHELSGPFQEAKTELWRAMYDERMEMLDHPDCEFVGYDSLRWIHRKGSDCLTVPSFEEYCDGATIVPLDKVMATACVDANARVAWCECTEGYR